MGNRVTIPRIYLMAGGVVAAALVVVYLRGPKSVGADLGGAAVDLADGVITGTVTGIGERVGIPKTDASACAAAKAAGSTWDASFACPAGDFLSYLWN